MACQKCNDLDLDAIFARSDIPDHLQGDLVAIVKDLCETDQRSNCQICSFFATSTSELKHCTIPDDYDLRAFNYHNLKALEIQSPVIPKPLLCLKLLPHVEEKDLSDLVTESDLILPVSRQVTTREQSHVCHGQVVDCELSDFTLLRGWLPRCETQHRESCAAKNHSNFQGHPKCVINCSTRRVVQYDTGDYAALSYRIGPSPPKPMLGEYPQVVCDAIELARQLGIHFLWVDQFCIDQDNKAELLDAMAGMNYIYAQARITIVSLGQSHNEAFSDSEDYADWSSLVYLHLRGPPASRQCLACLQPSCPRSGVPRGLVLPGSSAVPSSPHFCP